MTMNSIDALPNWNGLTATGKTESEVIEALISAGLTIDRFREYPFVTYKARQGMIRGDDGLWRLPPEVIPLPLMFTISASMPSPR